jgi:CO/xanthine dehydrogenase FAD-binding subunit
MKIIQHADCFEVRSERGSIVKRFPFDDNSRRRAISRRMTRKQAFQAAKTFAARTIRSKRRSRGRIGILRVPVERRDRARVNKAVRDGIRLGPLRPAGTADLYGVPRATE